MKRLLPAYFILGIVIFHQAEAIGQSKKTRLRPSRNFEIQQLAPSVRVAIHKDNYGGASCRAGIVDLGDKTLIFDPFMTPSAAYELREIAKKLTKKNNYYVVNSHYHNDHIRGTQAFVPNATIISTKATRSKIEVNEPAEQEWERKHAPTLLKAVRKRMVNANQSDRNEMPYWIGYYEGIIESSDHLFTALPDYTFDDSLWIEGSKLSVKLVECRNSHTASDAVLLIPSLGIAFMGDILYTDRHPWLSDGDVEGWKKTLKGFYEDSLYHTYLPGHGSIATKTSLKILYEYLSDVTALSSAAVSDSAQTALMNQPIPAPYRGWLYGRFYQPNLQFLINEARIKRGDTSNVDRRR